MDSRLRERFSRQIVFPPIGLEGQEKLLKARVAVVGCGALGSFAAGALLRSGVRHLILIDRDYVELSNLQRQWLFDEKDAELALPKAVAAQRHLKAIDSEAEIRAYVKDLTAENINELLSDVELVLDGTDNFETRYLLNDFCVQQGIPWIYAAAVGSYGVTMPVLPGYSCCFACVFPDPPRGAQPTCETAGVLNSVCAFIASIQVSCALQALVGGPTAVVQKITTADLWEGWIRQHPLPAPRPDCQTCQQREFPYLNQKQRVPISLCGRNAVQIHERNRPIDLEELKQRLSPLGQVSANEFALRFVHPPYEIMVFPDGRAIIKGTEDIGVARSLYARFIGS